VVQAASVSSLEDEEMVEALLDLLQRNDQGNWQPRADGTRLGCIALPSPERRSGNISEPSPSAAIPYPTPL
jgi:hypothetical protein